MHPINTMSPLQTARTATPATIAGAAYRAWASIATICGGGVFQVSDIAASISADRQEDRGRYAAEVLARATFEVRFGILVDHLDSECDVAVGMLIREALGQEALTIAIGVCEANGVPLRGR